VIRDVPAIRSHKDLEVWRAAVRLAGDTYALTQTFSKDERFGLSLQLRRSSVSIASNIAEGAARQTKKEFVRFLYMAAGSTSELDTQLEIATVIGHGEQDSIEALQRDALRVAMMLNGLIRSLK
jgi:four helix bundle protein